MGKVNQPAHSQARKEWLCHTRPQNLCYIDRVAPSTGVDPWLLVIADPGDEREIRAPRAIGREATRFEKVFHPSFHGNSDGNNFHEYCTQLRSISLDMGRGSA
jgi:hypothetical protein